jgi:hypothetical protein
LKVLSYNELITQEGGTHVQKGMNFGIKGSYSIVLMSTEKNAPYNDRLLDDGIIEYEGHDAPKSRDYDKKLVDQPIATKSGTLTENGKFYQAADNYKSSMRAAAKIKVYRKIRAGVWVDMGLYDLVDASIVSDGVRQVFKFSFKPNIEDVDGLQNAVDLLHNRQIPGDIQREVYERDQGQCRKCGSGDNLHFDHILPYSKGGTSKSAANIQLLCARHNLFKSDKFV